MKVRLVAYRKATASSTIESTYELDLQAAPNISINYQFSDVKEPETRKSSFTQTFKLPFTETNNNFFQEWYNVNIETSVYSPRLNFDAALFYGTVVQFEGQLQLKSVLKKAELYEVVIMSNTATLFSTIGEKSLKDIFKNSDGSYSADFNHVYNHDNIKDSWEGGTTDFKNVADVSLRDADAGVQKIMYPLSINNGKFYYNAEDISGAGGFIKRWLRMDQSAANSWGYNTANIYSVPITQLRPAIQLRTMLKRLIANAGFSYTSSFIDSDYFGKLFMTIGNHIESPSIPSNYSGAPSGVMAVGSTSAWGTVTGPTSNIRAIVEANQSSVSGCPSVVDTDNVWNTSLHYFVKKDETMTQISFKHIVELTTAGYGDILCRLVPGVLVNGLITPQYGTQIGQTYTIADLEVSNTTLLWTLDLQDMPLDSAAFIVLEKPGSLSAGQSFTFGAYDTQTASGIPISSVDACADLFSKVMINWTGDTQAGLYGSTVDIPACIDPEITQRDFLKDILQRFNLVITTSSDDESNLIIQPYNDYIASGSIRHWTYKIDKSKEIVIKDTSQLQKKTIILTDQEDDDVYNKSIRENLPSVNVFGHLKIDETGNDFASGEFTNESIFSPFINSKVWINGDATTTHLTSVTVQYDYTYETDEETGDVSTTPTATKSKLFYYNGQPTEIVDIAAATTNIYMHLSTDTTVLAFAFSEYPLCSPFTTTNSIGQTLTENSTSLYWNSTPPLCGDLSVFQYEAEEGNWFNNALYGKYWKPYLDNIYDEDARIMECYLNLNEVDISNFSFADEIFIQDTYWRILKVQNYQVGSEVSTKVTLIKSLNTRSNCNDCNYVPGKIGNTNLWGSYFFMWCPEGTPGCTPDILSANLPGLFADPECCVCNGGGVAYNVDTYAATNLYPCIANSGSLPLKIKNIYSPNTIISKGQIRTLVSGKFGNQNLPATFGTNNNKYSQNILPTRGDDIVIKYKTDSIPDIPALNGESHRIVLIGNTTGNTRGYAYTKGTEGSMGLKMPPNANLVVKVKGTSTVVGGTSSSYLIGETEAFAWYTGFKIINGTATQLSTTGGAQEFNLRGGAAQACTLHIDINNKVLRFGLDDSQTDTKRVWALTADFDINIINNMSLPFDANWALYQNARIIQLQNGEYLLWN